MTTNDQPPPQGADGFYSWLKTLSSKQRADGTQGLRNAAARVFPEFARVYTRIYDLPGCSAPYTDLLNWLASGLLTITQPGVAPDTLTNGVFAATASALYDFPWWYVSRPLLEAMRNVTPPSDIPVDAGCFRFPSMSFLLPSGVLYGDAGENIHILNASLISQTTLDAVERRFGRFMKVTQMVHDCMLKVSAFSDDGVTFFASVPVRNGYVLAEDVAHVPIKSDPGRPADSTWSTKVLLPLMMNLITVMATSTDAEADNHRRVKTIKGSGREKWTPRHLGKNYRRKVVRGVKNEDGTGRTMPTHWRGGHWRGVWHGPGRTQHKMVLIDPVLVNPPN